MNGGLDKQRRQELLAIYRRWVAKLQQLRKQRRWRQQDVADRVSFSRSQYCAIERGHCIANYLHLFQLAEAFGISLPRLLTPLPPQEETSPQSDARRSRRGLVNADSAAKKRHASNGEKRTHARSVASHDVPLAASLKRVCPPQV